MADPQPPQNATEFVGPPPDPAKPPEGAVRIQNDVGEAYYVTPDVAAAAIRSGDWGMAPGDRLPMINPQTGEHELVEASTAVRRLGSAGARVSTVDAYRDQEESKEFRGSALAKFNAAGSGLINSLALGFGDAALAKIGDAIGTGDAVRERLAAHRKYLGDYRMAGEVAGFALPALVTAGGYGALRGATAAGRGLAAAGTAVEGAVARGLVRAGAAEGGLLARGAGMAAGQALELGVYGAGEGVSRAVVENPGLTAEQAVAAMGGGFLHGAAVGAAAGGALGFGGGLAGFAATKAIGGAASAAERLTGRTARAATETVGGQTGRLLEALSPGGLKDYAQAKALQATGANQPLLGKVAEMSPAARDEAAKLVVDELPKALGKREGAILSHTEQAKAAEIVKDTAGKAKGVLVDELHAAGIQADVPKLATEIRARIEPLRNSVTDDAISAANAGDRLLSRLEEKLAEGDVKALWKQQRQLGDEINWAAIRKGEASLTDKLKADTYFAMGRELERVGTNAESLGAQFVEKWKAANVRYQAADWVTKATKKGAEREAANRALGLSEQLGGLGGSSLGASIGGAVAGPVGAFAGSVVGGAGAALAQRLVKMYGDQTVASALRRAVAGGGDLTTAAGSLLEQHMSKATIAYLKGGAEKTVATAGRVAKVAALEASKEAPKQSPERRFPAVRETVLAAKRTLPSSQAQAALPQQIGASNAEVAAKALATQQRAVDYLLTKIPPAPQAASTLQPHLDPAQPPPAEMAKFLRTFDAVSDPTTVLKSLEKGDITPEQVDALRVVYPEMYAQVQRTITAAVAEQGDKKLPYGKVLALSQLFNTPLDPSLQPAFVAAQQAAIAAPPEAVQPPPRKPMKPSNLAQNYALNPEEP